MINACQSLPIRSGYSEPFEDRIDILFHELELASKWHCPSVLFSIYNSENVHSDAVGALGKRLCEQGQSVYHISVKDQDNTDISLMMSELANLENVVFFVDGLHFGVGENDNNAYQALVNHEDFFVENQVRVVFWLTENEAIELSHFAPDYWASRHRVVEFIDPPKSKIISSDVLESAWQGIEESADNNEDLDAKIALRTAFLDGLPEGDESTAARANLVLTLGMLHWRKGDCNKATQFLNTALDLATRLQDNSFKALCFNAIALIETNQGKTKEAIQAYQNAIELAPKQIAPWNILGNLYQKLGQTEESLVAYQKAIEHNPTDAVSWNGLGELYCLLGRNDKAIDAYLKATEVSPFNAASWSRLGSSYANSGRLEDAVDAYQKVIEIDRDLVDPWLSLGDIHRTQKNHENAKMAYQTALEIDPQNALAWSKLGAMYYSLGNDNEAIHAFSQILELNCTDGQVYSDMASIYTNKGMLQEAIPLLQKGIELVENTADKVQLWNRLGDAYRKLDYHDNADAAYHQANILDPEIARPDEALPRAKANSDSVPSLEGDGDPVMLMLNPDHKNSPLAALSVASSPPKEASAANKKGSTSTKPKSAFLQWLEGLKAASSASAHTEDPSVSEQSSAKATGPDKIEAASEEAAVQEDVDGNPNAPRQESKFARLTTSTKEDPNSMPTRVGAHNPRTHRPVDDAGRQAKANPDSKTAQIWNELGNIYLNTGALDEAIQAFSKATDLDPSYAWTYNSLAAIYFQKGHYSEAALLYQKAIRLLGETKDKALLWNRLGDTYRRLKENNNAAVAYQKAAELDPEHVSLLARARLSLLGNHRA